MEPAQYLLHPQTWKAVHQPFVFPGNGAVSSYTLSGYGSSAPFPIGWADNVLSHDGSNNEWYSRSAVYLHGPQPFAVLAAFNAAPSTSGNALAALLDVVTSKMARLLEQQRVVALTPFVNPSTCPLLPSVATFVNSPLSLATGTWVCGWNVASVFFTPIVVANTSSISSISVYPYSGNSGTYNVTLAIYSKDGLWLGQARPALLVGSQYSSSSSLTPWTVQLQTPLLLANDTYYLGLYYDQPASNTLLLFAYPTPLIYYTPVPSPTTFSSVGGNLSLVQAEQWMYGAGEYGYAALVKLQGNVANCSTTASAAPVSQSAQLCLLSYGLPGNVDYPWSSAVSLTVSYNPTAVTTAAGTAVQLVSGTGTRTYTNRFGDWFTTALDLSSTGGLLYLNSPWPVDGTGLTVSLRSPVQLPGNGPATLYSTLKLYNASGVVAEGGSAVIDSAAQAFVSSIPGFTSVTIGASNGNALAASYSTCQAPIAFTNGLRQPTEPNAKNGGTTVQYSYTIGDGSTYSVQTTLTMRTTSAFASTADQLGNPYQTIVSITGTRVYNHLPSGTSVTSQVTMGTTASAQHFYPYSLLASGPGVYAMNAAPFLDAEGLTLNISPAAPAAGLAVGVGTQYSSVTVHLSSTSNTAPLLNEGTAVSRPTMALQQQTYSFSP